jgi:hypothetical protein
MLFWLNFYLLKKLLYFMAKPLGLGETSLLIGKTFTHSQNLFISWLNLEKKFTSWLNLQKKFMLG